MCNVALLSTRYEKWRRISACLICPRVSQDTFPYLAEHCSNAAGPKCCANMKHPNKAHTEVREKGICCQLSCTFSFLLFRTLGLKRERTGKTEWYGVHESERNEIQPTLFYASRILLLHPSQSDIAKPFMEPDPSNNPSSFVRRGFPFKYISVRSHFWIFKSGSSPQR